MELKNIIEKRRSIRDFDPDKQVEKNKIDEILNAAIHAPVGKGQYNDIHLTVIQNKNIINKIVKLSKTQNKSYTNNVFYNAPTIIIVSQRKLAEFKEIGYSNAGCIMENILLTATDLGLASVYILSATRSMIDNPDIFNDIKLPKDFTPTAIAAIGYNNNDNRKKFNRTIETNWLK